MACMDGPVQHVEKSRSGDKEVNSSGQTDYDPARCIVLLADGSGRQERRPNGHHNDCICTSDRCNRNWLSC